MDKVSVIRIDTGTAKTSVKELRKELRDLRDALYNVEQGTEEYNALLVKAADIQHRLKQQMEEVNASAMDFGQITQNIVRVTGGMVAGLQAVTAAMNLFGIENEDVVKSLRQMQNLMALTQAIPAIENGVKAFRRLYTNIKIATSATTAFSRAMIATGMGAIVALVGTLAANWDKVRTALTGVNQELIKQRSDEVKNALQEQLRQIERTIEKEAEIIRLRGGSSLDVAKNTLQIREAYLKNLEESKQALIDEDKALREEQGRLSSVNQLTGDLIITNKKRFDEITQRLKTIPTLISDYVVRIDEENKTIKRLKDNVEDLKEIEGERQKIANKTAQVQNKTYKEEVDNLEKVLEKIKELQEVQTGKSLYADITIYLELLKEFNNARALYLKRAKAVNDEIAKYSQMEGYGSYVESLRKTKDAYMEEINALSALSKEYRNNYNILEKYRKGIESIREDSELPLMGYYLKEMSEMTDFFYTRAELGNLEVIEGQYEEFLKTSAENFNFILKYRATFLKRYIDVTKELWAEEEKTIDRNSAEYVIKFEEFQEKLAEAYRELYRAQIEIASYEHSKEMEMLQERQLAYMSLANSIYAVGDALQNMSLSYSPEYFLDGVARSVSALGDLMSKANITSKDIAQTSLLMSAYVADGIAKMLSSTINSIDQSSEEGFERAKTLQIALAIVSTLQGIVGAWSSALQIPFPGNVIVGTALSAMMAGVGGANIDQIKRTKFGDSNSSFGSSSVSSSAVNSITAPVQYTQDVQGASLEGAIKDTRVYVLESDISGTTKKVNVAEKEARF